MTYTALNASTLDPSRPRALLAQPQPLFSEARKYRLSLNIAHQNFDQISPKVLSAIIKNTGTLTAFNVNFEDAEKLAASFHPIKPDALANSTTEEYWARTSGGLEPIRGFSPAEQACFVAGIGGPRRAEF
jgi:hypothetical protein